MTAYDRYARAFPGQEAVKVRHIILDSKRGVLATPRLLAAFQSYYSHMHISYKIENFQGSNKLQ